MITHAALIRFTENRLNTLCLNFEKAYAKPEEETVHDLRVAMRRMATHLEFMSFVYDQDADAVKKLKTQLRRLKGYLKSLNHLRDLQINLKDLQAMIPDSSVPRLLIAELKQQEVTGRTAIQWEMDLWILPKVRRLIKDLIHQIPVGDRELEMKVYLYMNYLTQELHSAVHCCHEADLAGCHRLRIRLKKYRYHLEMLEQGFGLKQILLGAVKAWQEDLGALQDNRMLLELIDQAEPNARSEAADFREHAARRLDKRLKAVQDEVHAIRFETQLKP